MIPLTKQIADLITWARVLLVPIFVWLGLSQGVEALPLVVIFMILNWTGDSIDGPLARLKSIPHQTWIGARDLEVDMLISCALVAYMTSAGLIGWQLAVLYLLLWGAYFWLEGILRSPGMLFQTPIYGWFIVVAFREAPIFGWSLVIWLVIALAVTWPRFPQEIVPGFLSGLRSLRNKRSHRS